jgi:hypothetical protein
VFSDEQELSAIIIIWFFFDKKPKKNQMMMIAFITFKSSLVPLFEGV